MKGLLVLCGFLATTCALPLRQNALDTVDAEVTDNVRFYLYTASNPEEPQELRIDNKDSVQKSLFDKGRHTKILIHGWGGSYTTSPNGVLHRAYFTQQDYNIISVDWYPYAKLNYISARAKAPIVGENIAELLDFLHEQFNLNYDKVVVIGHSLGAHIAGFCGKSVKRGKIAGIVGLDPASPLYSYNNPESRLSSDDAKFVISIHTNSNFKGFSEPIGAAAFYPNWGRIQPGCGLDLDGVCSHARCISLYAEALRGYGFVPMYQCGDYDDISSKGGCTQIVTQVKLGDPLQIDQRAGIYYFTTNSESPFGVLGDRSGNNESIEYVVNVPEV
ncbi:phospholipase A1-like [Anastrepha obliqua]|uniref:phospholipase A1-like n=1 Tax=Anastrepha obliqua TaxID=95512 RepID=UPI002409CF93|nr:phospholipase A1-like [Anastrepha obliqua]